MFVTNTISASLILAFDLENLSPGEITVSQTVAGYFVLVTMCSSFGFAVFSIGYIFMIR